MGVDLEWAWQGGTSEYDVATAVVIDSSTGYAVVAGYTHEGWIDSSSAGEKDFAAVKLDADGEVLWSWQAGTSDDDVISAAAMEDDGSVVLVGRSKGLWGDSEPGEGDFAAVRLDEDGEVVWKWQNGTDEYDRLTAVAVDEDDGSMVFAGATNGDWGTDNAGKSDQAAVKLDADGELLWVWQDGGSGYDALGAAAIGDDSSVVLGGYLGDGDTVNNSFVIKLDEYGEELWRWTSPSNNGNGLNSLAVGEDDTIIGAGWYYPDYYDHYAFKLDADGGLLWEYEGSNGGPSIFEAVSVLDDGTVVMTGSTTRDCDEDSDGCSIEVVWLDEDGDKEGNERTGSGGADDVYAAAIGPDDAIVIAGRTLGNFMSSGYGGHVDAFAGKVYLSR